MVLAMLESDEEKFEKLLHNAILRIGFESTITELINPLFSKIGMLWQSKTITSPHEHFVSNIIRRKIIASIDSIMYDEYSSDKTFLLFLPDREWHELGLLYAYYLLKKRGIKVIYLGQSVPVSDLKDYTETANFDFMLSSVNSINPFKDLQKFVDKMSDTFPNKTILVSGYQFFNNSVKFPENMIFIKSFDQLISFIEKNT
jgi:methanogenic corrinoid protein MtbC1